MAKTKKLVSYLKNVPLFQGLDNRQLKQIASLIVSRSYQPDEEIVTQGKSGFGMFTIKSGRAEAVLKNEDGSETVVNEFGPTDFFGEVALLDGGPRTASVIAREDTKCLYLGHVEFIALMHGDADIATEIAVAVAQRLRRAIAAV